MERAGGGRVVQVRLLGGVGAVTDGGEAVDVGPAKCRAVLATLALSVGTAVPVPRLVESVWGEDPPRTADRTLQTYVTRLRKALGPAAIARVGCAYRLDVPADAVDVVRFQRRLDAGDLAGALAGWRGPPLAGEPVPGLTAAVDGLVERWLGAVEADLADRIGTDPVAAVPRLTELTAQHPYREGLWALLMSALYRAGRQADALAAYRTVRRNLVEHLGVEPGPRLRELESSILRQEESPAPAERPTGTVTFGFTEVADAGWWVAHRAATARHDQLVRAAADRHGGYVFATAGAGFGVAFHRARDAASWAAELQAATTAERWPGGVAVRLRIGLHTGETDERGPAYFGPAVHLAARLAAAGHGGQTLLSATTAALLDRDDLSELGTHRLDGVVAEQRVLQLGPAAHPPLRADGGRRGDLPRLPGRLIGRADELVGIDAALAAHPVVTLVGPGGIGKTRLAVAAAERSADADRAWFVDLAGIRAAAAVARAVAAAVGVAESPGRDLDRSLVAALRHRRALLVLDNCEHVVDGVAELAQALAEGCPRVRVLATSREGLGLAPGHERLVAVGPLDPAGAGVELFDERAAAVCPGFDPVASRPEVLGICRRLDGVPLAIELAAARTTSLAPAELLARLDDQLHLLVRGRRTGGGRHRTLRAAVQWSYDLLTPPERLLLDRLSIFVGPFDLAAAGTVAADPVLPAREVDELLGALVNRSMLLVEPGPFGRRFRLLEPVRRFAAEQLAAAGGTEPLAERHTGWCRDAVAAVHALLTGPGEVEGVARLDELWPHLRAAVDRACARRDPRSVHALVRPVVGEIALRCRGEVGEWAERILEIAPPGDGSPVVFGLTWAAQRYKLSQDAPAFRRLLDRHGEPDHPMIHHADASVRDDYGALAVWAPRALGHALDHGEPDVAVRLELDVAAAELFTGRCAEAERRLSALVERFGRDGPPTLHNWSLMLLGYSAAHRGDAERAERMFESAIAVGLPPGTHSPNKPAEARAVFRRGDRDRAYRLLGAHVDELLDTGNLHGACVAGVEFVAMMARAGRLPEAARVLHYLDTSGLLEVPVWRALVADARRVVAAAAPSAPAGAALDDRRALSYMRGILAGLTGRSGERGPVSRR